MRGGRSARGRRPAGMTDAPGPRDGGGTRINLFQGFITTAEGPMVSQFNMTMDMDLTDEQRAINEAIRVHIRAIDDNYNALFEELEDHNIAGRLDAELRSLLEFEFSYLRDDVNHLVDVVSRLD